MRLAVGAPVDVPAAQHRLRPDGLPFTADLSEGGDDERARDVAAVDPGDVDLRRLGRSRGSPRRDRALILERAVSVGVAELAFDVEAVAARVSPALPFSVRVKRASGVSMNSQLFGGMPGVAPWESTELVPGYPSMTGRSSAAPCTTCAAFSFHSAADVVLEKTV